MGMKVQVQLNDLSRSGNPPPKIPTKSCCNYSKARNRNIKLDLHGLRAEEAIENLDKFLSDALFGWI